MTKMLLVMTILVAAIPTWAFRPSIQVNPMRSLIGLELDSKDPFTINLIDALTKSSEVKKVEDPENESPFADEYQGKGFSFTVPKNPKQPDLFVRLHFRTNDEELITVSPNVINLAGYADSLSKALYVALVASTSSKVEKSASNSLAVDDGKSFYEKQLACGTNGEDFFEGKRYYCNFTSKSLQ